jgi:hypothetical protein
MISTGRLGNPIIVADSRHIPIRAHVKRQFGRMGLQGWDSRKWRKRETKQAAAVKTPVETDDGRQRRR